jgi:hypothetical protein
MEATANKIEEVSADMAGPAPALQDKAAVPDEPIQPKPLRAAAVGAAVGLAIGVALAWWLAAQRRARPREDSVQSQAHVDDDLEREADLVEHSRNHDVPPHAASAVGGTGLAIQESPEQVRQLADVHHPRALESVRQPVNSLGEDQDLLSSLAEWLESQHQNFPQITAERLRDRLLSDRVAVLLRTDEGLDLAGSVGWHPNGVSPIGRYDLSILRKLGGDGARLIGSEDRRELANAGLIGKEAQAIVVAPLEHENVPFGMLLVGQEEPASEAPPQGNGVFDAIGSFARSVAPDLHAWLLLHRLREQLASGGNAEEQTTTWPPYPPAASGSSHGLGSAVPPDSQRAALADQQDEAQLRPD